MSLPYDIDRCRGTEAYVCSDCRRKEPGRAEWQTYIEPPVEHERGECLLYIPPAYRTPTKEVQR